MIPFRTRGITSNNVSQLEMVLELMNSKDTFTLVFNPVTQWSLIMVVYTNFGKTSKDIWLLLAHVSILEVQRLCWSKKVMRSVSINSSLA